MKIRSPTIRKPCKKGLPHETINLECGYSFPLQGYYTTFLLFKKGEKIMRKKMTDTLFCLWDCRDRVAGSAEINGKQVNWDAAYLLIGVPIEHTSNRIYKYPVAPDRVNMISKKLATVCWGTLIQLTFSGKEVIDVEVMCDWLSSVYDNEE